VDYYNLTDLGQTLFFRVNSVGGLTSTTAAADAFTNYPSTSTVEDVESVSNSLFFSSYDSNSNAYALLSFQVAPPSVSSITINNGSAQRSMVDSITVTFSTAVTLDPGAFAVDRRGQGAEGISVSTSVVNGDTIATITFVGSDVIGGSLADGNYTLTVNAAAVHSQFGASMTSNATDAFWRLFGDARGTGSVDALDYQMLLAAERTQTMLSIFDYFGTGHLDRTDLSQFLLRFGKHA
jgi:Bacterial Ig-like domain